jgi:hypothetical protein
MGRKIAKLLRCPWATVSAQSNHIQSDSTNDVRSDRLNWEIKVSRYNATTKNTHRKLSEKSSMPFCLSVLIKETRRNLLHKIKRHQGRKTHLWVYTQKYSTIASRATTIGSAGRAPDDIIKWAAIWQMKEEKIIWAYTRNMFSTISSGATPIRSAGRAPDKIIKFLKRIKEGERKFWIVHSLPSGGNLY